MRTIMNRQVTLLMCTCAGLLVWCVRREFNHEIEIGHFQSFAAAGSKTLMLLV
jgi:hypothetical protein